MCCRFVHHEIKKYEGKKEQKAAVIKEHSSKSKQGGSALLNRYG